MNLLVTKVHVFLSGHSRVDSQQHWHANLLIHIIFLSTIFSGIETMLVIIVTSATDSQQLFPEYKIIKILLYCFCESVHFR